MDPLRFEPVRVALGRSEMADGYLVFAGDGLLGVLARLHGEEYGELQGKLHVEADFTGLEHPAPPAAFSDLAEVSAWFQP